MSKPSLDRHFYVVIDGEQEGPISAEELQTLRRTGGITAQALCWEQGMPDWVPFEQLTGFSEHTMPPTPPIPANHPTPPGTSKYRSDSIGFILLAIPLLTTLLTWLSGDEYIGLAILATAVLAGVDAYRLGMGAANDRTPKGKKRPGPLHQGGCVAFFWIVCLPLHLYRRRNYGARNLLWPGIFVCVFSLTTIIIPIILPTEAPNVNDPVVLQTVEKVLSDNPGYRLAFDQVGQFTINSPVEVHYDRKNRKRIARAFLKTSSGDEKVIYYSVQSHDAGKGTFFVRASFDESDLTK